MPKSISPAALGAELRKQLTLYADEKVEAVNAIGEKSIKKLVKITRGTAPKRSGDFAKSFTYTTDTNAFGDKEFTWGAKAPHHRLTHLVVKGHPAPDGSRVPGNSFLQDAMETVLPEYEREVEDALRK